MQQEDLLGSFFNRRYKIISTLAAGGMGETYRAWDFEDERPVVVKVPSRSAAPAERILVNSRFKREIAVMRSVSHDHIVPVIDSGMHEGVPFVVLRFLPGGSLRDRSRGSRDGKPRPCPPGILHDWLPSIADALDFLHSNGYLHRDVKPENIFFDGRNNAFLGDFGLAKKSSNDASVEAKTLTGSGFFPGTAPYVAPELLEKKNVPDRSVDQYSLATTVYEALTGQCPFDGSTSHVLVEIATLPVPTPPLKTRGLPPSLIAALVRGLSKNPGERFPSCRSFARSILRDVPVNPLNLEYTRLSCPACKTILKVPSKTSFKEGRCSACRKQLEADHKMESLWIVGEKSQLAYEQQGNPDGSHKILPSANFTDNARDRGVSRKRVALIALSAFFTGLLIATPFFPYWIGRETRVDGPSPQAIPGDDDIARTPPRAETEAKEADPTISRLDQNTTSPKPESQLKVENQNNAELLDQLAAATVTQKVGEPEPSATNATDKNRINRSRTSDEDQFQPQEIDLSEAVTNSIGMKLRLIPDGVLKASDYHDVRDAGHDVVVKNPFYLGSTEVTNAEWFSVMGERKGGWTDEYPVVFVDYYEACSFCAALSMLPDERAAGRTYRLPTETEWEHAFYLGQDSTLPETGSNSGWFAETSKNQAHPVGTSKPNNLGIYDMRGNVYEWCVRDSIVFDGLFLNLRRRDWEIGLMSLRGGGWESLGNHTRDTCRLRTEPTRRARSLGLRVVMTLETMDRAEASIATRRAKSHENITNSPVLSAVGRDVNEAFFDNVLGMRLARIPPPDQVMVSEDERSCPFYLGVTEVTEGQWASVWRKDVVAANRDLPACDMHSQEAWEFCEELSSLPEEAWRGIGYRLPWEDEWEFGCRGTVFSHKQNNVQQVTRHPEASALYSFGNDRKELSDYCWYQKNSNGQRKPVGTKKPNAFGLFDMHGNVAEWCRNSRSRAREGQHVARGGGWSHLATQCTSGFRFPEPGLGQTTENAPHSPACGLRVCALPKCVLNDPFFWVADGWWSRKPYVAPKNLLSRRNSVNLQMRLVPPCISTSDLGTGKAHDIGMRYPVFLSEAKITLGQWLSVMGSIPKGQLAASGYDEPVDNISWQQAVAFCDRLTELEKGSTQGLTYRLPTLAELECIANHGIALGSRTHWRHAGAYTVRVGINGLRLTSPLGFECEYGNSGEWCAAVDATNPIHAIHNRDFQQPNYIAKGLFGSVAFYRGSGFRVAGVVHPRNLELAVASDASLPRPITGNKAASPELVENSLGMQFQLVPAGEARLRSAAHADIDLSSAEGFTDAARVFQTRPFYLGLCEVTESQFVQVLKPLTWEWRNRGVGGTFIENGSGYPVQVNAREAERFCRALSTLPAERAAGRKYRLPTEAEWVHAAMLATPEEWIASQERSGWYSSWYSLSIEKRLFQKYAHDPDPLTGRLLKVCSRQSDRLGFFDLFGNAREICSAVFSELPRGRLVDPRCFGDYVERSDPHDNQSYGVFEGGIRLIMYAASSESGMDHGLPKQTVSHLTPKLATDLIKSLDFTQSKDLDVQLDGLEVLTPDVAAILGKVDTRGIRYANYSAHISLNGLSELSVSAAKALLSQGKSYGLSLDGLTEISLGVAEILAHRAEFLSLNGLEDMSLATAEALALHEGDLLSLCGIKELRPEIKEALLKHRGRVLVSKGAL